MILLDANIPLEMLVAGRPKKNLVFEWMEHLQQNYCISMLTVHLVLHFGIKDGLKIKDLKHFLSDYPKIALLPEDYVLAMEILRDSDHEDALQLATALRNKCTDIATLDKNFSLRYNDKINFITVEN